MMQVTRQTWKALAASVFAAWLALTLYQIVRISEVTIAACGYSAEAVRYKAWTPDQGYPEILFYCAAASAG